MAQRRRPGAGREGLVDVDEIQRDGAQQALEGAADVDRERSGAPSRATRQGDALADRDYARVLAPEEQAAIGRRPPDQPAALADRRAGVGRGNDQHPVATPRELVRGPSDELVDLMPATPRMRTDLSDR